MTILDLEYNFASLSVKDLLEARDAYHYHLLSKANVVGTAIGLYLIRKDEAWPSGKGEGRTPRAKKTYPRTLFNSEVRDYSWPCVLVFVRTWADESAFGERGSFKAAQIVPKTLYMADGRAVPVCVVEAPPVQAAGDEVPATGPRPAAVLGGGCPLLVETQGELRQATAGGLVTDGHTIYAITARHACGEAGSPIDSIVRGGRAPIGRSSDKQLTRLPFSEVYPEFPGRRSYSAIDVGLVRIDAVSDWTSNTYGLPPLGPLADLHEHNISLRLIDQPVVGFGAASGLLRGAIKALFYRHRSVGGFDYVGDFLIAPAGEVQVRPGDSGMLWHLDVTPHARNGVERPLAKRDLRPLALEWGGQVFSEPGQSATFAVATSLASICRLLDVELLTDVSRGVANYWGRTGHYSIAALAIERLRDARLKTLMTRNARILSFELSDIEKKGFDASVGKISASDAFVPLADVPDEIWKKPSKARGGRTGGRDTTGGSKQSNGPEHPNHYADIDAPYEGSTLRDLCKAKPDEYLTVKAWQDYYKAMAQAADQRGDDQGAKQYRSKLKQGLLPFRLWQFFDAMKAFVAAGDIEGFVTAAGISAHYMGDASQPLHGSILADGDKSREGPRRDPEDDKPLPFGDGVHSAYETQMVSRFASDLLPKAKAALPGLPDIPSPRSGFEVAKSVIDLMDEAARTLPPTKILTAFEDAGGGQKVAQLDAMYAVLGRPTAKVLALGAQYLAELWEAAWREGGGAPGGELAEVAMDKARSRYIQGDFVPSLTLDQIGPKLKA